MKYMKNKRDNKKAFFRVLKELGLYTEWTKCRRKRIEQLKINNVKDCDEVLYKLYGFDFGNTLIYSFGWDTSSVPRLWSDLACMKVQASLLINNKTLMNRAKEIVKKYACIEND